jgi:hypothetical protein
MWFVVVCAAVSTAQIPWVTSKPLYSFEAPVAAAAGIGVSDDVKILVMFDYWSPTVIDLDGANSKARESQRSRFPDKTYTGIPVSQFRFAWAQHNCRVSPFRSS